MLFFFFFQAEDGIRDIGVTGVQTCALPILILPTLVHAGATLTLHAGLAAARAGDSTGLPRLNEVRMVRLWTGNHQDYTSRSEERRVGKEGRSRWSPYH